MYSLESNLKGQPIISLQTGQAIAEIYRPIIDVANLEIKAYACAPLGRENARVLLVSDIRQFAADCLIIDDEDQLTEPEDIVRLEEALKHPYSPINKPVFADTGRRVGSVEDYSINLESSRVQQLFVRQPFWHGWLAPNVIIDRTQILDVTPDRITVRDATITDTVLSPDSVPEINP
jgi:sporulation protein YlmC with PRC-barrel domain